MLCIIVGVVEYVWWCKNGDDGKFEGSGVDVVILFMLWLVSVIIIVWFGILLFESDWYGFEVIIE